MKTLGKAAGITVLLFMLAAVLFLLFTSMKSLQGQNPAAPPTPALSLNPSLLASGPAAPASTVTQTPTPSSLRPTPTASPFPTPSGALPTVGPSQYVSKTIIFAPVGSGVGSIGLKVETGIPPEGPPTFYVDRKNGVFVLDSWNKRVSKYDSNGLFLGITPFSPDIVANGLAVADNRLFVSDEHGRFIRQYDEKGTQVLDYTVGQAYTSGRAAPQLEGVELDATGKILAEIMTSPGSLSVAVVGTAEKAFAASEIRQNEKPGFIHRGGSYNGELIKDGEGVARYMDTRFSDGRSVRVDLRAVSGQIVAGRFLEFDSGGNHYYLVGIQRAGSPIADRVVLKYNVAGSLQEVLPVPAISLTSTRKGVRVSEVGDVYYMYTTSQQVTIVKWQRGGAQ